MVSFSISACTSLPVGWLRTPPAIRKHNGVHSGLQTLAAQARLRSDLCDLQFIPAVSNALYQDIETVTLDQVDSFISSARLQLHLFVLDNTGTVRDVFESPTLWHKATLPDDEGGFQLHRSILYVEILCVRIENQNLLSRPLDRMVLSLGSNCNILRFCFSNRSEFLLCTQYLCFWIICLPHACNF